ncbi:MAG: hypothetical protein ACJAVK_001469 [Akkermansiaceae bacterium]|jgi:hypothetical protein
MITIRKIVFALLFSGVALAKTWPEKLAPGPNAAKYSHSGDTPFTYLSTSYKVISFKDHDPLVLADFMRCAESVSLALQAIPLPLYDPPPGNSKGIIQIVANEERYRDAGGAKNTAGFYDGRQAKVIIQWSHFKNSASATRPFQEPAFDLLIHELTHLGMHGLMWKAEPWFTEGVAEYLAAAHTDKGNFDFTEIEQVVRARIESHRKPGLLKTPVLGINSLLKLTSKDWLERTATLTPWQTLEAYNTSLLLVHYVFHGSSERRRQVQKHLETLKAISKKKTPRPKLFALKEAAQIERALQGYWKNRGLRLAFSAN